MSSHKHEFYICTLTLLPPTRAIHHMKTADCSWAISKLGLGDVPSLLSCPQWFWILWHVKISSTFSPKSCQELSQAQWTHLSINYKSHSPLPSPIHHFLTILAMWGRKIPYLLSSFLNLLLYTLSHSIYFLFWRQLLIKTIKLKINPKISPWKTWSKSPPFLNKKR